MRSPNMRRARTGGVIRRPLTFGLSGKNKSARLVRECARGDVGSIRAAPSTLGRGCRLEATDRGIAGSCRFLLRGA